MQIRVRKLRADLTLLQSVVPKKPTLEILSNIMVKDGALTANNLEAEVSLSLKEAEGSCWLLPYRSVMDFLKYVPGDELITIDPNGKKVKFSSDSGSAAFDTKDAADFPVTELKEPVSTGLLDGDVLIPALVAAVRYCATDQARPVLSGATIYLGNVLQIAAADGFRLSFQSINQSFQDPENKTIIIPADTIVLLDELWEKEPAQVGLANDLISQITAKRQLDMSLYGEKSANLMEMKFGRVTLVSHLVAGNPPDHLSLLNNFKEPIKVRFMGPEMYNAVRRVRGLAREANGIARLVWDESRMTVSAMDSSGGEINAVFPVLDGGNPGRIAINIRYLMDYFADKDGVVTLGKSEEKGAPALFHYGSMPIVAVMPMQVNWGDEKPATIEKNDPASERETEEASTGTEEEVHEPEPVEAGVGGPAKEPEKVKEKLKRRGRKKKST